MSKTIPADRTSGAPQRGSVLGEAAARRRRALGLRQAEVAELAGCSERFVHTMEHGKETLRHDKALDVLEVLGLGLFVGAGRGRIEIVGGAPTEQTRE